MNPQQQRNPASNSSQQTHLDSLPISQTQQKVEDSPIPGPPIPMEEQCVQMSPVQHLAQGQHLIIRTDSQERNLVPSTRALEWDEAGYILATLPLLFLRFGDLSLSLIF